jgi:REase_DpnII-MboI
LTTPASTYATDVVDEQHLPEGGRQPRAELGIVSLRLIIEVKLLRSPIHVRTVGEDIAADTGLSFRDAMRFERMVVFIYDESDRPQPERHATTGATLKLLERVADMVIIRRPSFLPDQQART